MSAILNVASYRFVAIADGPALRQRLHGSAQAAGLKGSVLLAPEGINLVLAGRPAALLAWLDELQADARFRALEMRRSFSRQLPFRHLRVKLKAQIIRIDRPGLRPGLGRAPALPPATLAAWLGQGHDDHGRALRLLDTRNAFEVDAGAFEGAIDWRLKKFGDFPEAPAAHRDELRELTVVSYCTGGIRCEKAALLMREQGLANSWQLDGGILNYFEATDGRAPGWRGRCFVFDERVSLDCSGAEQ